MNRPGFGGDFLSWKDDLHAEPEGLTAVPLQLSAGPVARVSAGANAIAGIDLAGGKQMVVVCDHDSRVIARRTFRCRAWDLGSTPDWAGCGAGWAGVTVAHEPAGHRWRMKGQLAAGTAESRASLSENAIIDFRIPRSDEVTALIDESGVDSLEYDKRYGQYRLRLTTKDVTAHRELLLELVRRASKTPPPMEE